MILLPLSEGVFRVLAKSSSILSFLRWNREWLAVVGALLKVSLRPRKFFLLLSFSCEFDLPSLSIQVLLSFTEAFHGSSSGCSNASFFGLAGRLSERILCVLLSPLVSLGPFDLGDLMSV